MSERRPAGFATAYDYPYHWIPHEEGSAWHVSRVLAWGLEYLLVLDRVRDEILALTPRRVLDVGCGDGRLAGELLDAGISNVVGVDIVEQAVAFARAFNLRHGGRARFVSGRVEDLDEHAFDVAVAMETLEHIPERDLGSILRAVWQRLRPEGHLVVSVPTTVTPLNGKDERHYDLGMLQAHLSPWFKLERHAYVHSEASIPRMLRRLVVNRWWAIHHPAVLRGVTKSVRRLASTVDQRRAGHLVARSVRVDRP